MRILFLTNLFPPHDLGGLEQLCQEMTDGLRVLGHQVSVLTSRYGVGPDSDTCADATVGVERSLYLESGLEYYRPLHFLAKHAAEERANLIALRRAIDHLRPDLLVVWGMWQLSLNLPAHAEQLMPGRVVYYFASYWPLDVDPHTAYWRLPARRALTERLKRPLRRFALARLRRNGYPPSLRFEHAICVSEYVRQTFIEAGTLTRRAKVIHCGVDPGPFLERSDRASGTSNAPLRLLYFGRLIADKGVHTAVEAMAALRRRRLDAAVDLTIVGAGSPEYETRLRRLVDEHQFQGRVRFVGRVPKDEIARLLSEFDVFLSTSIWPEPLARTILFAMLSGLVVVASDAGGTREVFRHYDEALLFPPGDADALADRIVDLLEAPGRRRTLAERGRRLVLDRFTVHRTAALIEAYLRDVVGKPTAASAMAG